MKFYHLKYTLRDKQATVCLWQLYVFTKCTIYAYCCLMKPLTNLIPNRKELGKGKRMGLNRFGVRCSRFFFLCRSSRAINNPQRSQENVTTFKSLQFAIYKRMIILFSKQVKSWHQIWNHSTISNNKSPAFLAGPYCVTRTSLLLLRSWTVLPF